MTESLAVVRPAPMEGSGFYNRSSRVQAAGLSPAVSLFERAARTVVLPRAAQPIVMPDCSASEGHDSLGPLAGTAISALLKRVGKERQSRSSTRAVPSDHWSESLQEFEV